MLLFSEGHQADSNGSPLNECMALLPFQTSQAMKEEAFSLLCEKLGSNYDIKGKSGAIFLL